MSATFDPWPPLSDYELPRAWVAPALGFCRSFNTLLDKVFYDVEAFERATGQPGRASFPENRASTHVSGIDLSADTNPEGSLLVVGRDEPPGILHFRSVDDFLASTDATADATRIVTITGVGSSALGSAALAWDVARAFGEPVLAIVPGYGVADALLQGLGGWFGYGLHDALKTKTMLQKTLAAATPAVASVGRRLSAPYEPKVAGAPIFEHGSGSADVLHALLGKRTFKALVGHSKGALAIGNALGSFDEERIRGLLVITFGCPIATAVPTVRYAQFLGLLDALGILNSWCHSPSTWIESVHTTNSLAPLNMPVVDLCRRYAPLAA